LGTRPPNSSRRPPRIALAPEREPGAAGPAAAARYWPAHRAGLPRRLDAGGSRRGGPGMTKGPRLVLNGTGADKRGVWASRWPGPRPTPSRVESVSNVLRSARAEFLTLEPVRPAGERPPGGAGPDAAPRAQSWQPAWPRRRRRSGRLDRPGELRRAVRPAPCSSIRPLRVLDFKAASWGPANTWRAWVAADAGRGRMIALGPRSRSSRAVHVGAPGGFSTRQGNRRAGRARRPRAN